MRYPASEKLEIIQLVERSHLPVRRTLSQLGIAPSTFYHWYDRYQSGGHKEHLHSAVAKTAPWQAQRCRLPPRQA